MVNGTRRGHFPLLLVHEATESWFKTFHDQTGTAYVQIRPCDDKDAITSVTKRLLFHHRLQYLSTVARDGTVRQEIQKELVNNLIFSICSPGEFPPIRHARAGITDGNRHGVVESTLSCQRCSVPIKRMRDMACLLLGSHVGHQVTDTVAVCELIVVPGGK